MSNFQKDFLLTSSFLRQIFFQNISLFGLHTLKDRSFEENPEIYLNLTEKRISTISGILKKKDWKTQGNENFGENWKF